MSSHYIPTTALPTFQPHVSNHIEYLDSNLNYLSKYQLNDLRIFVKRLKHIYVSLPRTVCFRYQKHTVPDRKTYVSRTGNINKATPFFDY